MTIGIGQDLTPLRGRDNSPKSLIQSRKRMLKGSLVDNVAPLSGKYIEYGIDCSLGFGKVYVLGQPLVSSIQPNDTLTLVAGPGITLTTGSRTVSITSTGGSGAGDVVGPSGADDGDVVIFDGDTGKLITDSGIYYEHILQNHVLGSPNPYEVCVFEDSGGINVVNGGILIQSGNIEPALGAYWGRIGSATGGKFQTIFMDAPGGITTICFGDVAISDFRIQTFTGGTPRAVMHFDNFYSVDFYGATALVDVINESTTDAGVTIEGVLIKDGLIPGLSSGYPFQLGYGGF